MKIIVANNKKIYWVSEILSLVALGFGAYAAFKGDLQNATILVLAHLVLRINILQKTIEE